MKKYLVSVVSVLTKEEVFEVEAENILDAWDSADKVVDQKKNSNDGMVHHVSKITQIESKESK
jgi:hypothetical protein